MQGFRLVTWLVKSPLEGLESFTGHYNMQVAAKGLQLY